MLEQLPPRELWQGRHRLLLGLPAQGAQPLPAKWDLSISKNLTLEVLSGSSIIYNLVAKQQDSFRAIITIDKERM